MADADYGRSGGRAMPVGDWTTTVGKMTDGRRTNLAPVLQGRVGKVGKARRVGSHH
jgi:hypothetical protein